MRRALDAGYHLLEADIGGADDAPAQAAIGCGLGRHGVPSGRAFWIAAPLADGPAARRGATMPQMRRGLPSPGEASKIRPRYRASRPVSRRACRHGPPPLLSRRLQ